MSLGHNELGRARVGTHAGPAGRRRRWGNLEVGAILADSGHVRFMGFVSVRRPLIGTANHTATGWLLPWDST